MATNNLSANRDTGMDPILGILRARVEDNRDPLRLGRVRIRIPSMHGIPSEELVSNTQDKNNLMEDKSVKIDENSTTTNSSTSIGVQIDKDRDSKIQQNQYITTDGLPWAYPVSLSGGGSGHGGLIVPQVGDYVFVSFENGDRNSPIYFGGCYGIPSSVKYYGSVSPSDHTDSSDTNNGLNYQSGIGLSEAPAVYDKDGNPTIQVLYSSSKGSSISINDSKGSEKLQLSDRSQQSISLVHPSDNKDNKIMISSGPTQLIQVISKSHDSTPRIELCSGFYYDKENRSLVTMNNSSVSMNVNDIANLHIDKSSITLSINGTSITISDGTIQLVGDVEISGNLKVSGNINGDGDILAAGHNSNHHKH